jgi:hypothetical protein
MQLLSPRSLVLVGLTTLGLAACVKESKAPEAPVRKGAKSSDQCPSSKDDTSPAPSYGGGAYLADATVQGTWANVKALVERDCKSCHPQYVNYEDAKPLAGEFVKSTDDGSMPKNGEKLSLEDRQVYILWALAGAPNDGEAGTATTPPPATDDTGAAVTPPTEESADGATDDDPPPPADDDENTSTDDCN